MTLITFKYIVFSLDINIIFSLSSFFTLIMILAFIQSSSCFLQVFMPLISIHGS